MPPITKTQYLSYLNCKEETWMSRNMDLPREVLDSLLHLALEDGQQVDRLAKEYMGLPGVVEEVFGEPGSISLQETFEIEGKYKVIADIVFYPATGGPVTLVEVKASTAKYDRHGELKPKFEHIHDLAFQQFVLEAKGIQVGRTGLLLVSKDYRYSDAGLDLKGLFQYGEVTKHTDSMHAATAARAAEALAFCKVQNLPLGTTRSAATRGSASGCVVRQTYPPTAYSTSVASPQSTCKAYLMPVS